MNEDKGKERSYKEFKISVLILAKFNTAINLLHFI
jgi:hypothetical protein